ncbi:MAG: PAS domain S-box protein, partial [Nitrospirales bacterium]
MESSSGGQHAILIVDDEVDICLALQDLFVGEGYRVDAVETGTDALNHIHPSHPYSAVILDLGLPDLDGLTVLQLLHEMDPTLPVIILTAHGDQKEKITTLQHHAFAHFTKPYDREELTAIVQSAIAVKDLSLKVDQTERELHSSEAKRQFEYQRAQTLLSQSEQRLRVALKAGNMGIWDWDTATNQIVWSDEVAELFGLSPGTLENTYDAYVQCIHPDDRAMVAERFQKALDTDAIYDVEHRIVWPTGEIRWYACKGQVVKNQEGRSQRIVGTVQDITTKKQDEKRLRENQTFLTSIVENLPHMIFVKEAKDLRFLRFNKAGEDLLGHSRETLIGKTDYDFFPQEQADFFTTKDYEVLANKKLVDIPEEIIHTKFQGTRYLHTKKIPLLDEEGNPQYLLGISEDITDRKQAELERDEGQLLLNLIFETGPGCLKRVAADGTLLHMNPAGLKLIEADKESDALGLSVFDLVTPEYRSAFEHMHYEVIKGKTQTLQFEIQGLKGGRRWMETYAGPFRNPLTKEVEHLGVTHDITERKRAEEHRKQLSQKNELILSSVGEGIYGLDLGGRTTFVNPAARKMLGYQPDELLGQPMHSKVHHTHLDGSPYLAEDCPMYAAFKDGTARQVNHDVLWRKDGTSFPVEYTSTPIFQD